MLIKPSRRVIEWAKKLVPHAEKTWVLYFFAVFFFIDSFILVMPIDGVMVVALVFVPHKLKKWFFYSVVGAGLGYVVMMFLTESSFQPMIVQWVQDWGSYETYQSTLANIHEHGYLYLSLAAYTVVPQNISLVTSLLADLNVYIVFFILVTSKIFKLWWMHQIALHSKRIVVGARNKWKKKQLEKVESTGS